MQWWIISRASTAVLEEYCLIGHIKICMLKDVNILPRYNTASEKLSSAEKHCGTFSISLFCFMELGKIYPSYKYCRESVGDGQSGLSVGVEVRGDFVICHMC